MYSLPFMGKKQQNVSNRHVVVLNNEEIFCWTQGCLQDVCLHFYFLAWFLLEHYSNESINCKRSPSKHFIYRVPQI